MSDLARHDRQVFEALEDGLLLLDVAESGDLRILQVNPALERLAGIRAADVVGRSIRELGEGTTI